MKHPGTTTVDDATRERARAVLGRRCSRTRNRIKNQTPCWSESLRGAISTLADDRDDDDAENLFEDPCPEGCKEAYDFAETVLEVVEKAAKASKKNRETYRTQLLEGCLKDGRVSIRRKRKETDIELIARVVMGLIRGGIDLEEDKWLRVVWHWTRQ